MSHQEEHVPGSAFPPGVTVWFTENEAGRYLRYSAERLRYLRRSGGGPPFHKLPTGKVRYKRADLDDWVAEG